MIASMYRFLPWLLATLIAVPVGFAAALDEGAKAPNVSGKDLQTGAPVELSKLQGKVVLVDFWASWCAPCKAEMPVLEKLSKRYGDQLVVVGVSVDNDEASAKKFLEKVKVSFPVVHDAGHEVADAYAPPKMPSSYLIDKSGRVRYVQAGFRAKDEAKLEAEIKKLLK